MVAPHAGLVSMKARTMYKMWGIQISLKNKVSFNGEMIAGAIFGSIFHTLYQH
jgi:hypothetical protein